MAEKIGDGYVEISARIDKVGIKNSASEAGEEAGDELERKVRESFLKRTKQDLSNVRQSLSDMFTLDDRSVNYISRNIDHKIRRVGLKSGTTLGLVFGETAGIKFAGVFQAVASSTLGTGVIGAVGVPLVAGLATWLGAAVAGAVVGAVGVGGIVGGIALAANDSRVRSSFDGLVKYVGSSLKNLSAVFVPEIVTSIGIIEKSFKGLTTDIRAMFQALAPSIVPFISQLTTGLEAFVKGFTELAINSGPAIEALGSGIQSILTTLGKGLSNFSDNTESTARAFHLFLMVIDQSVAAVFRFINALTEVWQISELVGRALLGDVAAVSRYAIELVSGKKSVDDFKDATDSQYVSLQEVAGAALNAASSTKTYVDALNEVSNRNLSAAEANLKYRDALDKVKGASDGKTKVSREEESALIDLAKAYNTNLTSMENAGYSSDKLRSNTIKTREEFIKAAVGLGYTSSEANDLANSYLNIPDYVRTNVVNNAIDALAGVRTYIQWLSTIPAVKYTRLITEQQTSRGGHREFRWGGVVEHAQNGLLRESNIYSPSSPATYAFAEAATGGEAFIPRLGNMARSRAIAEHVVENWLGGMVSWGAKTKDLDIHPIRTKNNGKSSVFNLGGITVNISGNSNVNGRQIGNEIGIALLDKLGEAVRVR